MDALQLTDAFVSVTFMATLIHSFVCVKINIMGLGFIAGSSYHEKLITKKLVYTVNQVYLSMGVSFHCVFRFATYTLTL